MSITGNEIFNMRNPREGGEDDDDKKLLIKAKLKLLTMKVEKMEGRRWRESDNGDTNQDGK